MMKIMILLPTKKMPPKSTVTGMLLLIRILTAIIC